MTSRRAVPGKQNLGLYKYAGKKKDTYWVRQEIGDKVLDERLKADNLNDARTEAKLRIREWQGLKPKQAPQLLVDELWEKWLKTKEGKSQATRDSIRYASKHLLEFFGDKLPSEINPELWEEYISYKKEQPVQKKNKSKTYSSETRKFFNERKWFVMFLIYLHKNDRITKVPDLRDPDPEIDIGRVLEPDEILKILEHAKTSDLKLQIIMSLTMGTRDNENKCLYWVAEFEGKKYSHIDFKRECIVLLAKDTKIRKGRTFALSKEALVELEIRRKSSEGIAVFPSQKNPNMRAHRQSTKGAWKRCRAKAEVKCRFHDLRHTYLTNAFRNSKGKLDSLLICDSAGLDIKVAQEIYLHFNLDDLRPIGNLVPLATSKKDNLTTTDTDEHSPGSAG